ncbi:MAG: asparagine synthase (glutamine-hydrolyzing) [Gemmatimonadetes bacterium]|nr:asparagine synthase (glutamine-hydrolyzing) [Gemmatimonadota bacterium]
MCGIAGMALAPGKGAPDPGVLDRMCRVITHRGPDDQGTSVRDGVALGMRRLSIIDVADGRQPLRSEDGAIEAVFNGEIYNFRELRRELEEKGHSFASRSDGEVLPHLWEEYGPELATRLNGMYAVAIHDTRRRKLFLLRDRIGVKPLYYAQRADQHLVFGSEIKSLLESGRVERELDVDALNQFLTWEYVPAPATLFRDIRKLPPGCWMELDLESFRSTVHTYWDVPGPHSMNGSTPRTRTEWGDAVDAAVGKSVHRQLVSDVPLGAFLSGGVDSSLLVHHMGDARTFSIGFDDPSYNELDWSQRVADHLGVTHRTEIIRPDVVGLFDHLMNFMDDPIGDFSIFPTYLVSRLAREDVTVVLSGDGGDELFGGYETYVAQQMARSWMKIPSFLRKGVVEPVVHRLRPRPAKKGLVNKAKRFLEGMDHPEALGHTRWRRFLGDATAQALMTAEARTAVSGAAEQHVLDLMDAAGSRNEIDRGLYVDLKSYLSDNILVKVDRMSMAVSLEARVPFLDHEVVELAFCVPPELKLEGKTTKVLLKEVAARHIPRECIYRPKEGFSIPIKNWLGAEFRPLLEDALGETRLRTEGLFDPATVTRMKHEHLQGTANHSHLLWALLVFQDWRRRWGV